MRKALIAALLLGLSGTAKGHEIWIERDGDGPARIYLGEPADPLPEGGDPEFSKLKAPKLIPASGAPQHRKAGFIEVAVPQGDVRAIADDVFAPWGPEGEKEGVVYYARAGRSEPRAIMPLEIAPVTANGTRFVLMRDGKPVPGARITIISPDKWSKNVLTDANGTVDLPIRERGRYLLSAAQKDEGDLPVPGGTVATLHRIATTTFIVP